jgi:hypothetical protein
MAKAETNLNLFAKPWVGGFFNADPDEPSSAASLMTVTDGGLDGTTNGASLNLIFSSLKTSTDVMHQAHYSFDNDAYVLTFGERLGVYEVSATTFPTDKLCDGAAKDIKYVQGMFSRHKLKGVFNEPGADNSQPRMVRLNLGSKTILGYFISFHTSAIPEDSMAIQVHFTLVGYVKK